MKIKVLAIGKIKEAYWRDALEEYGKRLSGYCTLEIIEVEDEKAPADCSDKEATQIKEKEGRKLLSKIKPSEYVVALDLNANTYDSPQLAARLEEWFVQGNSTVSFLIGGSLGLSDEVKKKANERFTLSRLTFTHQMTRVILLEQIYRAFKINRHETYHK